MFEIVISKVTPEILLTSISVWIVWFIYRKQIIDERKRILNSINALLKISGEWFGTEYSNNHENQQWYSPNFSVFPVDTSQIPNILTSNLLQEKTLKYLSFFIQLVSRFNHRIDLLNNFLNSNQVLFKDACLVYKNNFKALSFQEVYAQVAKQPDELRFYIEHLYTLQKEIHSSIGQGRLSDEIPSLSLCFRKLQILLDQEKKKSNNFFRGAWIFPDFIFLVIPIMVVVSFLLNFTKYHLLIY